MSFLTDLKAQIISQPYKNPCCRRAMINGIIFAKGRLVDGEILIALESSQVVTFAATLIKEFFGKDAAVSSAKEGGRRKLLSFSSHACGKYLLSLESKGSELFNEKCANCSSAFLRGVFLACGRVTDPTKRYRVEFAPTANHLRLLELFSQMDLDFSITERRAEKVIYSGNSSVAEYLFATMGLNSATFFLMNSKIEHEFKNSANRIRNCETNNILKTVSAAARCVEAIEALEEANLLSTLPDELEKTARLRIAYKDYSLSRLAAEFTPPISKPGLSHRLNKIVEIADNLLKNKK